MKTDLPLKRLLQLRAADVLTLTGDTGIIESVEQAELATALRVDNIVKIRRGDKTHYRICEMQGDTETNHTWRWFGYGAVATWRYQAPVVITVFWLRRPGPRGEPCLRFTVDGREVNRWSFEYLKLWEIPAAQAVAGPPGLATLAPLMAGGGTLNVVRQAARRIEATAPPEQRSDLLAILGALTGRRYTFEKLVQIVGREAMIQSTMWDTAVAEGVEKGLEQGLEKGRVEGRVEGHVEEARQLCAQMVGEYHPQLAQAARASIDACTAVETLRLWVLRGPRLDDDAFAQLLGLR